MIKQNGYNELEKQVQGYLREVIDPELGLNIVDLGLVYRINVDELSNTVELEMTLTTQFCPMGASIVESVEETIKEYLPECKVEVNLTFDPKWNAGMISEDGQAFLER